ncbi:MAG: pirin family protein [Opitutales bacterium]|nr:pirin family protein [Opitutales bacterium]
MDPDYVGFRSLRVINQDIVAPGKGFDTHQHRSMEIFSYVIDGQLENKDSLGNGRIIKTGEFQYMSAGDGVFHSEFNPQEAQPSHFLQIWIQPREQGGEPRYRDFDIAEKRVENGLSLLASPDGRDNSAEIRQDAEIYFGAVQIGHRINIPESSAYQFAWVQVISGTIEIAHHSFSAGDGAEIEGNTFEIKAQDDAEFILFRLS